MSTLEDELVALLGDSASPFLFVGAGMSRRYLGLDNWAGLLRHFADQTSTPFDRFASDSEGDYAQMASAIARQFNPVWWESEHFAASREAFNGRVPDKEAPLKIEVARRVAVSIDDLDPQGPYAKELDLLRNVTIDGIITTNYDGLLEYLFPDFKTYIGQDELVFAQVQTIGEIYKIHGSSEEPSSLVLTSRDYERFEDKSKYLAAKLMTIFVDHPIVFLGYGMGDPNIKAILNALAGGIAKKHVDRLADRLIYVTWDPAATEPHLGHGTVDLDDGVIPLRTVAVNDYAPIFRALGRNERHLPAQILRQLRERVFELVKASDPVGALRVVNLEDGVQDMDVVFGVGAIAQLGALGYFGVKRDTLVDDVLDDDKGFEPDVLISRVLPETLRGAKYVPMMKYLRHAGLLDADGTLSSTRQVSDKIVGYVQAGCAPFGPTALSYQQSDKVLADAVWTFTALAEMESDPVKVLRVVHALPHDAIDVEAFRAYLIQHRDQVRASSSGTTHFAKAVCLYDWLRYATV